MNTAVCNSAAACRLSSSKTYIRRSLPANNFQSRISRNAHQRPSLFGSIMPCTMQQCSQQARVRPFETVIVKAGFGFGQKNAKSSSKNCPCGSGKLYSECCQVYHRSAAAHPDSPERLVRARYSAFVKKVPKYLRDTSHPDNPALQGSSTTLEDGTVKQCSYEEDLAVTMLVIEFLGLDILGREMAADGSSCTVDVKAHFKRLADNQGKRVSKPQEEVWTERATLVKNDEGHWLVREVKQLQQSAGATA